MEYSDVPENRTPPNFGNLEDIFDDAEDVTESLSANPLNTADVDDLFVSADSPPEDVKQNPANIDLGEDYEFEQPALDSSVVAPNSEATNQKSNQSSEVGSGSSFSYVEDTNEEGFYDPNEWMRTFSSRAFGGGRRGAHRARLAEFARGFRGRSQWRPVPRRGSFQRQVPEYAPSSAPQREGSFSRGYTNPMYSYGKLNVGAGSSSEPPKVSGTYASTTEDACPVSESVDLTQSETPISTPIHLITPQDLKTSVKLPTKSEFQNLANAQAKRFNLVFSPEIINSLFNDIMTRKSPLSDEQLYYIAKGMSLEQQHSVHAALVNTLETLTTEISRIQKSYNQFEEMKRKVFSDVKQSYEGLSAFSKEQQAIMMQMLAESLGYGSEYAIVDPKERYEGHLHDYLKANAELEAAHERMSKQTDKPASSSAPVAKAPEKSKAKQSTTEKKSSSGVVFKEPAKVNKPTEKEEVFEKFVHVKLEEEDQYDYETIDCLNVSALPRPNPPKVLYDFFIEKWHSKFKEISQERFAAYIQNTLSVEERLLCYHGKLTKSAEGTLLTRLDRAIKKKKK